MITEGRARLERNYKEDETYLQGLRSPYRPSSDSDAKAIC
jgi:hypothetical protein